MAGVAVHGLAGMAVDYADMQCCQVHGLMAGDAGIGVSPGSIGSKDVGNMTGLVQCRWINMAGITFSIVGRYCQLNIDILAAMTGITCYGNGRAIHSAGDLKVFGSQIAVMALASGNLLNIQENRFIVVNR